MKNLEENFWRNILNHIHLTLVSMRYYILWGSLLWDIIGLSQLMAGHGDI